MKMNKKGFTLIEMLVVIAIIAVLVAIIVPTVSSSTDKAAAATDAANLRSAQSIVTIGLLDGTYTKDGKIAGAATGSDAITADSLKVPATSKLTGEAFDISVANGVVDVKYGENGIKFFADIAEGVTKYTPSED